MKYTKQELEEFKRLLELTNSHKQMDRIEGRLAMPKFIEKHGKEKCDLMFKEI